MKILELGICDDDNVFICLLKREVRALLLENNFGNDVNIRTYSNGDELLRDASQSFFDLLLLDVEMPDRNGFWIAEMMEHISSDTRIIFVSAYDNYVFLSYEYTPLWFVRKESLKHDLSLAIGKYVRETKAEYFTYKIEKGCASQNILRKNIIYFESNGGHDIVIKTINMEYNVYGTLAKIQEQINHSDFIRIHRSYLINKKYIRNVTAKKIELINGVVLDTGRVYRKQIKEMII